MILLDVSDDDSNMDGKFWNVQSVCSTTAHQHVRVIQVSCAGGLVGGVQSQGRHSHD